MTVENWTDPKDAEIARLSSLLDAMTAERDKARKERDDATFHTSMRGHQIGFWIDRCRAAELQLRLAQGVIITAFDVGQLRPHAEDPKCPEDDCCDCEFAAKVNEAMRGYAPTPEQDSERSRLQDLLLGRGTEKRHSEKDVVNLVEGWAKQDSVNCEQCGGGPCKGQEHNKRVDERLVPCSKCGKRFATESRGDVYYCSVECAEFVG